MANNRLVALNNLTSQDNQYQKLSDGSSIGVNVLDDLLKYIELELKIKYKLSDKWDIRHDLKYDDVVVYDIIDYKDSVSIKSKLDNRKNELIKIQKIITDYKIKIHKYNNKSIKKENRPSTNEFNEAKIKIKNSEEELKKLEFIELPKIKCNFNSLIKFTDGNKIIYLTPHKFNNEDTKEIAKLKDDKHKLDAIFKKKHYGSFDSLVMIDFYKELSSKLNKVKKLLSENDDDIKKYTIEDIYKKLYLLYDIKSINLNIEDNKNIKDEYIEKKMSKQNTLNLLEPIIQTGGVDDDITFGLSTEERQRRQEQIKKQKEIIEERQRRQEQIEMQKETIEERQRRQEQIEMQKEIIKQRQRRQEQIEMQKETKEERQRRQEQIKKQKEIERNKEKREIELIDELKSKNHEALLKYLKKIEEEKFKGGANPPAKQPVAKPDAKQPAAKPDAKQPVPANPSTSAVKISREEQVSKEENIVDIYKKLKDVYINIVLKYYTLVQRDGDEDNLFSEVFKDESFSKVNDIGNNNFKDQLDIIKNYILDVSNKVESNNLNGITSKISTFNKEYKAIASDDKKYNHLRDNIYILRDSGFRAANTSKATEKKNNTIKIRLSGFKYNEDGNKTSHKYEDIENYLEQKLKDMIPGVVFPKIDNPDIFIINDAKTRNVDGKEFIFIESDKKEITDSKKNPSIKIKINGNDIDAELNKPKTIEFLDKIKKKQSKSSTATKEKPEDDIEPIDGYIKAKIKEAFDTISKELENLNSSQTIYKVNEKKIKYHINLIKKQRPTKEALYEDIDLNDQVTDIEARIKILTEILAELPKLFIRLYRQINKLSKIPQATEYEEFIVTILKKYNINLFDSDSDNKHKQNSIIKSIVNEKISLEELLKKKKKELERRKEEQRIDSEKIYRRVYDRDRDQYYYGGGRNKFVGGESKFDRNFEKIHSTFKSFITLEASQSEHNLSKLLKQMHDNIGYLEESGKNILGETISNIGTNVYETIWSDYNNGILKKENDPNKKYLNNFITLTEGENLHDKVELFNLNPEKVLAINFRDKAIFIFLMFLIRTISVISLEFLIDYNIIKTLHYSIIIYGLIYLTIMVIFVGIVNYDSYKFRIIFNYLNLHINSSNILLQIVLFVIFIILVFIIVRTDDFVDNINSLLDYTQVYASIIDIAESNVGDSDEYLSDSEKLKLKYRMDIVSMIVLIFSSLLVLIL